MASKKPDAQLSLPGCVVTFVSDGQRFRADYRRCVNVCKGCPHGPYWSMLVRKNGNTSRRYIGATRNLPQHARATLARLEGKP